MAMTHPTDHTDSRGTPEPSTGVSAPERRAPESHVDDIGRRVGYLVTIAVDAVMLYIFDNLEGWDISFLTNDVGDVVPLIMLSLLVGIFVNAVYLWYDPPWLRSLGQIGSLGVSLVATARIYQVFPFDFAQYSFDWALLARAVLVVALIGTAIGIVVELVNLVKHLATAS